MPNMSKWSLPLIVAILPLLLTTGCGKTTKAGDASPKPTDGPTTTDGGTSLNFDTSFSEHVERLRQGSDGSLWLARTEMAKVDGSISSWLENRQLAAGKVGDIISNRKFQIKDQEMFNFVVRDDGNLVTAGLEDRGNEWARYSLRLSVLNAAGDVKVTRRFEEYDFKKFEDLKCAEEDDWINHFFWKAAISIGTFNDQTLLLTANCAYARLTLLDDKLDIVWSRVVAPSLQDSGFYGVSDLYVTDSGLVVLTTDVGADDVTVFNRTLGTKLVGKGDRDILVQIYDLTGKRRAAAVIGTSEFDSYATMTISTDSLYVVTEVSVKGQQRDLFVMGLALSDLSTQWEKIINIDGGDSAYAATIVDKRYLAIAGETGYHQVNTGSVTKPADAFVLVMDSTGKELGRKIFGTSRNDRAAALLSLGADGLLVGGFKDGPITHSGDHDKSQRHSFGFVTSFELTELLK